MEAGRKMADDSYQLIENLINKYNTPVPRYTSYPTAVEFQHQFNEEDFFRAISGMRPEKPVSIYIHIPFCEVRCHYCGCNVIISRRKDMIDSYLDDLMKEIKYKLSFIKHQPDVAQIHFGGGTPNFLRPSDWKRLILFIQNNFNILPGCEQSIELDPMMMDRDYLLMLKNTGFNRVSFGLQDVNEKTQVAVNRIQDMEKLNDLFNYARELEFSSINVDFIYGLPYQTLESYQKNIEWILKYRPDRIAMFSYAHLPQRMHHQRNMDSETMPDATEKLKIYLNVREKLQNNGYVAIGMDHYALPADPLSVALQEKSLHRNFMGYATQGDVDMIAFGPSAISHIGDVFAQNHVKLRAYEHSAREREKLFEKGYRMGGEDQMRNHLIQSIMNNLYVDIPRFEERWKISFWNHFALEKNNLAHFTEEGLLLLSDSEIEVTETGRHVVRHIAAVFDEYRRKAADSSREIRFSKGI